MTAIEMSGTVGKDRRLQVDALLPIRGPMPVRVIVLLPTGEERGETEWVRACASSPAFDFLNDQREDIYSLADGEPFHGEASPTSGAFPAK